MKSEEIQIVRSDNEWLIAYGPQTAAVRPPEVRNSRWETYEELPEFYENAPGWKRGRRLNPLLACECTRTGALVPGSVQVKTASGPMTGGKDFRVDDFWGCVGRIVGSGICQWQPVKMRCSYYPSRVDSVILNGMGKLMVLQGQEGMATPPMPRIPAGAKHLANIFFSGKFSGLHDSMIYPVKSGRTVFSTPAVIPQRALAKLRSGRRLRILAWGDSVTECVYMSHSNQWQEQFVSRLRKLYPQAEIELLTAGWGGSRMSSWYQEPEESCHHFGHMVLDRKADLVISEFVNDAALTADQWWRNFNRAKCEFDRRGMEWIILTPHYVRMDWMGVDSMKNCENDPRPYVHFIRDFAAKERIPLADASRLWGQLSSHGIPYEILLSNGVNHPNRLGMSLFADALMPLFKEQ